MDTPCIPAHHVLRNEAISNINGVLEQNKATLVCDRDLMEIDVGTLSMALRVDIDHCDLVRLECSSMDLP